MKRFMIAVIIAAVLMAGFTGCSRPADIPADGSEAFVGSGTNKAPTVIISFDENCLTTASPDGMPESVVVTSSVASAQTQSNLGKPTATTTRNAITAKPTTTITKPATTTTKAPTTTTSKAYSDPWVYPYDPEQIYKDAKAYALSVGLRWMESLTKDNAHWVTPLSTVPWTNNGMTRTLEEKVCSEISEIKGFGIYTAINIYMEPHPEFTGDYLVYYLLG